MTLGLKGSDKCMAELIAYAIAGHHAGLPDMTRALGEASALADRMKKNILAFDTIWQSEVQIDLAELFPAKFRPAPKAGGVQKSGGFQIAFHGRMIFSCLVDADFLDTEAFYASVDGRQIDRAWPILPDAIERMITAFNTHMADKGRKAADTSLNRLRGDILTHVADLAAAS